LGGVQGLFLTFILVSVKKDSYRANKYLSLVVFVLSLTLIISFLHFTNLIRHVPHLMGITPIFMLLYGPLLFFYVSSYLNPDFRFRWKRLLHFIPFLVQLRFELPFLMIAGWAKQDYIMNIFEDRFFPTLNLESVIKIVHLSIYLALCYGLYRKAAKSTNEKANRSHQRKLSWVRQRLLLVSCFIWASYVSLYLYDLYALNTIIPILITLAFYSLGYMGFKYPEIVRDIRIRSSTEKYESSNLTVEDKDLHCEQSLRVMRQEKVFIDPELKMGRVAELLNLPVQSLSQIINEKFGQNFSEFINAFRVEEAKKKLLDSNNRHLTILAIAYEVGFNSKSAFNAAFKKATNQTPSQFIRNHNRVVDS
jgi:AraC-like DNA-binding protein